MINYTSAQKVIPQLPAAIKENETITQLLSWIYTGYQGLEVPQANKQHCCIYDIKNHKTKLCSDVKNIISVTLYDEQQIPFTLDEYIEEDNLQNCNNNYLIAHKLFLTSENYINSFLPMKYVGNMHTNILSKNCCNLYCNTCNNTFSIDENKLLTTNVKDGQICVVYNSHVRDDEGNMMIIDNVDVIEYLKSYVTVQHLRNRALREERIIGMLDRSEQNMNALYRKARGSSIMKSVNYKSLCELTTNSFNALLMKAGHTIN